jgi:hypothetical protein
MRLIARVQPRWSIAEANRVLYDKLADTSLVAALASLPELADGWKSGLPRSDAP